MAKKELVKFGTANNDFLSSLEEYRMASRGMHSAITTILTISKNKEYPLNQVFREALEEAAKRFEEIA